MKKPPCLGVESLSQFFDSLCGVFNIYFSSADNIHEAQLPPVTGDHMQMQVFDAGPAGFSDIKTDIEPIAMVKVFDDIKAFIADPDKDSLLFRREFPQISDMPFGKDHNMTGIIRIEVYRYDKAAFAIDIKLGYVRVSVAHGTQDALLLPGLAGPPMPDIISFVRGIEVFSVEAHPFFLSFVFMPLEEIQGKFDLLFILRGDRLYPHHP